MVEFTQKARVERASLKETKMTVKSASTLQVLIDRPSPDDEPGWCSAYRAFAIDYPWDDKKAKILWSWLNDPKHPMDGLVAKLESGQIVGFVHFKETPRGVHACNQGYIEDLYVMPDYRGSGIAHKLISAVVEIAKRKGWKVIRWITKENNYRARSFYDRFARQTNRLTYELFVEEYRSS